MSEHTASEIIDELLRVLLGDKFADPDDRGLMPTLAHGYQHTPRCPHGQSLALDGPRPHGDECSDRCLRAWDVILAAGQYLDAHPTPALDRQESLFREVSCQPTPASARPMAALSDSSRRHMGGTVDSTMSIGEASQRRT